jgi:urease accessory protein
MTQLAKTYLGNIQENNNLADEIEKACLEENCLEIYLNQIDTRKGRIYTQSLSGIPIGIIKSRDWSLREGDIFATEEGKFLLVHLQKQKLMVLSFSEPVSDRPLELIHLGHVLGNHHYPIIIQENKIYLQLVFDAEVIETTIRNFNIPGLKIDYELRSPQQQLNFSSHNNNHHHHS